MRRLREARQPHLPTMSGWFRSAEMVYVNVVVQRHVARDCIVKLGELGAVQFTDVRRRAPCRLPTARSTATPPKPAHHRLLSNTSHVATTVVITAGEISGFVERWRGHSCGCVERRRKVNLLFAACTDADALVPFRWGMLSLWLLCAVE